MYNEFESKSYYYHIMQNPTDVRCQIIYPDGFKSGIFSSDKLNDAERMAQVEEFTLAAQFGCSPEDLKRKVELHYYVSGQPDSIKELVWSGSEFRGQRIKR